MNWIKHCKYDTARGKSRFRISPFCKHLNKCLVLHDMYTKSKPYFTANSLTHFKKLIFHKLKDFSQKQKVRFC